MSTDQIVRADKVFHVYQSCMSNGAFINGSRLISSYYSLLNLLSVLLACCKQLDEKYTLVHPSLHVCQSDMVTNSV